MVQPPNQPVRSASPQPPHGGRPREFRSRGEKVGNGWATSALVLGIFGALFLGSAFAPPAIVALAFSVAFFLPAVLAVIFGAIGLGRAKYAGGRGKGIAIAGMVLGMIFVVVIFILIVYRATEGQPTMILGVR